MIYTLDASAILRFMDLEAGCDRVRQVLEEAAGGTASVLISAVNWGEVLAVLCKRLDESQARAIASGSAKLPWSIADLTASDAEEAGITRSQFKIPYADSFATALAAKHSATLVTADYDFKSLPKGTIRIEFLPQK